MAPLIRGGDGKLKGKRNRRAAQWQFYVWRRIRADMIMRLVSVDEAPKTIQIRDIQEAMKW